MNASAMRVCEWSIGVGSLLLPPALLAGCLDPTQIQLSLHTDVPYAKGRSVSITAGGVPLPENSEPSAVTTRGWLDDGIIGTLVVIPSGDDEATVNVRAVLGVTRAPAECTTQDADGCIIARRRLNYLPHVPLELPVTLHAACIGEPCDANSTCNALGQCVSAEVDEEQCREPGQCLVSGDQLPTVRVPVSAIAAGYQHACALLDDGRVKCWGNNDYGQLGIGETRPVGTDASHMGSALQAVDLGEGRSATQVVAGGHHTCARLDDGRVKCWGRNHRGQLGLALGPDEHQGDEPGEMGDQLRTVNFGAEIRATQLAAGFHHTCALLANGTVKCWGGNGQGQLAQWDSVDHPDPSQDTVVVFVSDQTVSQIATGAFHTCALMDDSTVRCWGDNQTGQLGTGDREGTPYPALAPLALPLGELASGLALGDGFSCARLASERLTCWGDNSSGQLGLDDQTDRLEPPAAPIALGAGRTVEQVATGWSECCVLLDDGTVKCWGSNQDGQLGLGDRQARGTSQSPMSELSPVDLGVGDVSRVTVGAFFACAVLDGTRVKCWGLNEQGQLGLGDMASRGGQTGDMGAALPVVELGL